VSLPIILLEVEPPNTTRLVFEWGGDPVEVRRWLDATRNELLCVAPCTADVENGTYDAFVVDGPDFVVRAEGGTQVWTIEPDDGAQLGTGIALAGAGLVGLVAGVGLFVDRGGDDDVRNIGIGCAIAGAVLLAVGIPTAATWGGGIDRAEGATSTNLGAPSAVPGAGHGTSPTALLYPQLFAAEASEGGIAYGLGLGVTF
jgi:hypothetical protein